MLALILVTLAVAAERPVRVVVEGAVGLQWMDNPHDVLDMPGGFDSRVALGGGVGRVDVYLAMDRCPYNGQDSLSQADVLGVVVLPGDGHVTFLAPGVRWRFGDDRWWAAGRIEAGAIFWDSPLDPDATEEDLLPTWGAPAWIGPHTVTFGIQPGAEVGVRVVDGIHAVASFDLTVMGFEGVPFRWTPRLGFVASF